MSKISLDLSSIKSPGIYTIEIDESQRTETIAQAQRILVGFNGKGPFNRPVFLQNEAQRQKIFGDIDPKLEKKACFFNRAAKTMLNAGPILALNLLKVDDSFEGPDQVNYAAMSLNAAKPNPVVADAGTVYGEYDYISADDEKVYDTSVNVIPFVGKTPYSSLFDRSRFWIPSDSNLMQVAAAGLGVGGTSFEKANFMNFANCGTDEISILVYKPEGFTGYDVTAAEWYGGAQNIPYGWIRPSDYISDYFIRVVAVKGNWSNFPLLASHSTWGKYFDKKGIKKDKIFQFCQAEGIQFIGSWTGVIFDFTDKQGNHLYIKDRVNAQSQTTGLLMSINEDAMEVISYDFNGMDHETGETTSTGEWIYDYDANAEGESELGETSIDTKGGFIIDMVGHGFYNGLKQGTSIKKLENYFDHNIFDKYTGTLDSSVYYIDEADKIDDITLKSYSTKVNVPEVEKVGDVYKTKYIYGIYDKSTNRVAGDDPNGNCYIVLNADNAKNFNNKKLNDVSTSLNNYPSTDRTGTTIDSSVYDWLTTKAHLNTDTVIALKKITPDATKYKQENVLFGNYVSYVKTDKSKLLYVFSIDGEGIQDDGIIDLTNEKTVNVKLSGDTESDAYKVDIKTAGTTVYIDKTSGTIYATEENGSAEVYGINFMSYNFTTEYVEDVVANIRNVYYFNGLKNKTTTTKSAIVFEENNIFNGENPLTENMLNQFIITDEEEAANITKGDLVQNIAFYNNIGEATRFGLIPGVTRITNKIFVNISSDNKFTYKGKVYTYNASLVPPIRTKSGKRGFYLFTAIDPVYIDSKNHIKRQLPISDPVISDSLRFIPLKGLHITAKHKPGYDANGRIDQEGGIEKIYSVLMEEGIRRALCDNRAISFSYIVDSMSGGIADSLGGKKYLSTIAMERGSTTAFVNLASYHQLANSTNPVFCDTYSANDYVKPSFNTKYVAMGGNYDMPATKFMTLPTELEGSKYCGVFFPHLLYRDNAGRTILVPPAADVSNTFMQKFQGGDPYKICAGTEGILTNGLVTGVEYNVDRSDMDSLVPAGINVITQRSTGEIVIYSNQTAYQDVKSDFNKLSTRENLNVIENAINTVLDFYTFKYNNAKTRAEIIQNVTPIMEAAKLSGAIDWYNLECSEQNNSSEVIANGTLILDTQVVMGQGCETIVHRITLRTRDAITE